MAKYIIICGGVISGTGKGLAAASMGLLMKMRGESVQIIKMDPYLNLNAGTMSPYQHGEVFLCNDGCETDLDLGHYERIAGIEVSGRNIWTSGTMHKEIVEEEESGKYLGQTVQVIPHITDKIINTLKSLDNDADIVIVEIGGTVGDLESGAIMEAIRQFKLKYGDDVLLSLVSPILWWKPIKEFKTKPLQQSVKTLQNFGLQPDMLLCRVDRVVPVDILNKVAKMTNVAKEAVFDAPDVKSIYQIPIEFYNRHVDDFIADRFRLKRNACRIYKYRDLVEKYVNNNNLPEVEIGVIGKYENCEEAYISLKEAIYHAGVYHNVKTKIKWINAEDFNKQDLYNLNGIIIPGGFDNRGVEGKIKAAKYAREKQIPFLGICLGLQCAVIDFARNVCGIKNANSMEFDDKTKDPVVHFVEGQESIRKKSGTMRLGAYDCEISSNSIAMEAYRRKLVSERHRHRYEVNNAYLKKFEEKGFVVSGVNPGTDLVEIMELDRKIHPYFIGTQAHPEFRSRLAKPNPLFKNLVAYAIQCKKDEPDDK